jgi:hypothetical protein
VSGLRISSRSIFSAGSCISAGFPDRAITRTAELGGNPTFQAYDPLYPHFDDELITNNECHILRDDWRSSAICSDAEQE